MALSNSLVSYDIPASLRHFKKTIHNRYKKNKKQKEVVQFNH